MLDRLNHNRTILALALAAVFYCGLQWLFAHKIGNNQIFSKSRAADKADVLAMASELSSRTRKECQAKKGTSLLFLTNDVVIPYLNMTDDTLSDCAVVEEIEVTPLSQQEWKSCNAIIVREFPSPPMPDFIAKIDAEQQQYFNTAVTFDQWFSSDGKFGFKLLRVPCNDKGKAA